MRQLIHCFGFHFEFWKYVELHSAVRQPHANSFNWTQAGPILREYARRVAL